PSAAGPQQGSLTLGSATSWYIVLATFLPVTPPTTTSTTTTTRPTTTSTTTTTSSSTTTTSPPATTTTTTGGPTTTTVASTTTTTSTSSTTTTTLAACLPTGSACRTNADCCSTSCRKKGSTKVCTSNIRTVFMILMENTDWSSVKNSASAPYINRTLLPIASHAE